AIMLTGASSGEYADSMLQDAISMLVFGAIGLVMITIGRFIQDKVVMRNVAILEEIKKGNLAAAFVDIGNVIAVGIVIRASMIWVETEGWIAIPIIFAAFIVSQVVLVGGAIYRINLFKSRNNGSDCNCMQQALEDGNHALGIRYAGYMIGLSLAITAASGMVAYSAENIIGCVISWAIAALVFSIAFMVFVAVARMAILPGIKVSDEVDKQKNASVGVIEAAIAVAIGLTFVSLFG
ncbi:MAG: DUF350 domain-containing protein, partial [Methylococcales bacterium]|nr:DUF350 domain-containing protein [Methylococcales bacterium]